MDEPKGGFYNSDIPVVKSRPLGGSSVMIWVGNFDQTIIGPFKVNERVILNCVIYFDLIDKTFFVCKSCSFKVNCVFMHENASFNVSKLTCEFFEHKSFTQHKR